MNCEGARDSLLLAAYGELPDEQALPLEQHLAHCEFCQAELNTLREMDELLALHPLTEPDPNLLAQSRMRLDEALDLMPQHGFMARVRMNAAIWFGHLQSAPALATLLVGVGFLAGNFTYRYQVWSAPKAAPTIVLTNTNGGGVSTISGIQQLPNGSVQVSYNRVVPEMAEGPLENPQIRHLLMMATNDATTNGVRMDSISLLASRCIAGQPCAGKTEDNDVRGALIARLHADGNPVVRMKALEALQPYVAADDRVRDAVAQTLLTDSSAGVRSKAIAVLEPVESDSSVQQVLRTVSTSDENPYLRQVSYRALHETSMQ